MPPILQAAMPVEAVMAMASGLLAYFERNLLIMLRRSTDFPVPRNDRLESHFTKGSIQRTGRACKEDIISFHHDVKNRLLLRGQ